MYMPCWQQVLKNQRNTRCMLHSVLSNIYQRHTHSIFCQKIQNISPRCMTCNFHCQPQTSCLARTTHRFLYLRVVFSLLRKWYKKKHHPTMLGQLRTTNKVPPPNSNTFPFRMGDIFLASHPLRPSMSTHRGSIHFHSLRIHYGQCVTKSRLGNPYIRSCRWESICRFDRLYTSCFRRRNIYQPRTVYRREHLCYMNQRDNHNNAHT
jgi:hypothetical protein